MPAPFSGYFAFAAQFSFGASVFGFLMGRGWRGLWCSCEDGILFYFFYFIPWKPTDTWPRDRCGRAQLVLLPSLVDFLHLGADL